MFHNKSPYFVQHKWKFLDSVVDLNLIVIVDDNVLVFHNNLNRVARVSSVGRITVRNSNSKIIFSHICCQDMAGRTATFKVVMSLVECAEVTEIRHKSMALQI